MRGQHPEDSGHRDYDEAELDAVLDRAMSGILAKLEAGFNPGAGLADIHTRCQAATPDTQPSAASPERKQQPARGLEPAIPGARLQEVCDQIDMLNACLAAVTSSAQHDPFAGAAYLEMARPALAQLRMGLANRALPKNEAERLADSVQSSLDQADRILQEQHATTLDQVVRARIGRPAEFGGTPLEQIQALREMIARLYADAGYSGSLVPAP